MSDSPPPAVLETLRQSSEGLLYLSETDAPFEPFFWPGDPAVALAPEDVARLGSAPADAPVKVVKLDSFFRAATKEEDWHNAAEKAEVARFREFVKTLKATLTGVQVFRIGEIAIDAYIVGAVEGGHAGLKTHVVET